MNSQSRVYVAVACVFSIAAIAIGQTIPPIESLQLRVDAARYRGDSANTYVEVYYAFPQGALTYRSDSSGFRGGLDLTVVVTKKDSLIHGSRWLVPHVAKDTSRIKRGINLVGTANLALPEGDYILKVVGRDLNDPGHRDSVLLRLPVRLHDTSKVALSDLELATSIKQGAKGSPFYKNTLEVIPNVEGIYSEDQRCFFYAEAYNLLSSSDRSDYIVKTVVYDAIGRELISREKPKKRVTESNVLVDNIDVNRLRSGTYTLVLALLDTSRNLLSTAGKKLYVYNPTLGVDSTLLSGVADAAGREYATVEEPEMDKEFNWARYAANDQEKDQYTQLNGAEPKRKFLSQFWHRRPLGFKEEYLKRVSYANSTLRILGRDGFRTDRGRVYIVYGPPDDYERHPNDSESRPYEIWSYNSIQGGVIFVFVLRQSGGDYELVHSTHRNELHDEDWGRFAGTR
jgi:GWxTD domain-containing protein